MEKETILELDKVYFATNTFYNAINNVNLRLYKGENAIIDANDNSGIVELFRLIIKLEKTNNGIIKFKGKSISQINYKKENILYIPQYLLFMEEKSVEYNLKYFINLHIKDKEKRKEILDNIIKEYNFSDIKDEKVINISNYQRAVLTLARGLFRNPELILIENIFEKFSANEIKNIINILNEHIKKEKTSIILWINKDNKKYVKLNNSLHYTMTYGTLKQQI